MPVDPIKETERRRQQDFRIWACEVTLGYLVQVSPGHEFPADEVVERAKILAAYVAGGE